MRKLLVLLGTAVSTAVLAAEPSAPTFRTMKGGEGRSWSLVLTTDASFARDAGIDFDKAPDTNVKADGKADLLSMRIEGELVAVVLRLDQNAGLGWIRVKGAKIGGAREGKPIAGGSFGVTESELAYGLFAKLLPDGTVAAVDASRLSDPLATQLLKFLAHATQAALPLDPKAKAWSAKERDASGIYEAAYKLSTKPATPEAMRVEKDLTGYSATFASGMSGKLRGHYEGSVRRADGWLADLSGEENAEAYPGAKSEGKPLSSAQTRLSLTARGELASLSREDASRLADVKMPQPGREQDAPEAGATTVAQAKEALGTASLDDIYRLAKQISNLPPNDQPNAGGDVITKLRALLVVRPNEIVEVEKRLAGLTDVDPWYRSALVALSTLQAQCRECAAVIRRQVEARAKASDYETAAFLLPLLADTGVPEAENESVLRTLGKTGTEPEIRDSAMLALGAVADRVKDRDPARADKIFGEFAATLDTALTKGEWGEQMIALEALGNTSNEKLPEALAKAMKSGTDTIRAEAFYSLRKVRSEAARTILMGALADPSPKVRKAALGALAFRRDLDGKVPELISTAQKDADGDVRHDALRIIGRYYGSRADVREAIDKIALGDQSKSVREFAGNIAGKTGDKPGSTLLP